MTGKGIRARLGAQRIEIGNLRLFAGEAVSTEMTAQVERLESAGRTTMLVRADGRFAGVIGLMDIPRPGVTEMLAELRSLGVAKTVMLTGDNERVARAVAQAVGLEDVRASLLPEDKIAAVASLVEQYGQAAMVGDGANDGPALARATVGIAMGGAGTDVALEAADVVLMSDELSKLPFAVGLSRAARAVIRQNLFISLGAVALLIPGNDVRLGRPRPRRADPRRVDDCRRVQCAATAYLSCKAKIRRSRLSDWKHRRIPVGGHRLILRNAAGPPKPKE